MQSRIIDSQYIYRGIEYVFPDTLQCQLPALGQIGNHHLGVELVAAGQPRDRLEGVGRQGLAIHDAALELEQLPLVAELTDRLGGESDVPLDQGERGGAAEVVLDLGGAGLVGGQQREAILDDSEAGVGVAQPRAELGGLRDADAAVVDREDRVGVLELGAELLYYGCLLVRVQLRPAPVFWTTSEGGPADGLWRLCEAAV